jgi:hypothetical protein
MTTESLSPASRIVIETFSRPPGERSTSISLIGAEEDAEPVASAVARGAMSVLAPPVVEPSFANAVPATKGADSGAPNGLDCGVDGAANRVGSSELSGALALAPTGAGGEAEVEARATGGGAETSSFRPLRAASCEAARGRLGRFDESAGEAIGAGAVAFAIDGTASSKFGAIGLAREKPATESLSPLTSVRSVKLAAVGPNGASFPRARLASLSAEVDTPRWKARSPTSRPTVA